MSEPTSPRDLERAWWADALAAANAERDAARAELEQLRARDTACGDEWGILWPGVIGTDVVPDEATARAWIAEYATLIGSHVTDKPRLRIRTAAPPAGEWRNADATETTDGTRATAAPEAPLAASEPTQSSVDGNTSSITPAGQAEATHDGNHPGGYGPTQHKGLRENCPAPDCLDRQDEQRQETET